MRPRTKINIPEPRGSEFQNFDRMTRILLSVKTESKRQHASDEKPKREKAKAKA